MRIPLIVALLSICSFNAFAQVNFDSLPGLARNSSWYVRDIPVPGNLKGLCDSLEGRWQIINSMDSFTKYDIKVQWMGDLMHGDSTHKTFESFLMAYVERRCSTRSGWQFNIFPNYVTFQFLGGPGQPKQMYCISQNTGGGTSCDCDVTSQIKLPDGWQVCKIKATYRTVRHGKLTITPALWYPNDNNPTPRFRGYQVRATGHGDEGNPSSVYLTELNILAIRDTFSNKVRKECGCDMPQKPVPPPPQTRPPTRPVTNPAAPAKLDYVLTNKIGNTADLIFTNTGGTVGRMYFRVDALDGDDGKWKRYEEGYIDIEPNSTILRGLHQWRVLDWKVVYAKQGPIE